MVWDIRGNPVSPSVDKSLDRSVKSRNFGCRITERVWLGELEAIIIENEKLRITVLAGRGADVVEFLYKPRDMDFAWLTSTGILGNALDPNPKDDVASFIDEYPGGWQTIFPNGGVPSTYKGQELGQHAEVAILPWEHEILEDTPERASVKFTVHTKKFPYKVEKTFTVTRFSGKCAIEERITNLSDEPLQAMWGFHFTFGPPFLTPESRIYLPDDARVIPQKYGDEKPLRRLATDDTFIWPNGHDKEGKTIDFSRMPPVGTPSEMLYVDHLTSGKYRVETPSAKLAADISWDEELFPYLWYWQEYGESKEEPWFGKHYNIGLEPFSSYPTNGLAEAIDNGTAITFEPHAEKVQTLSFEVIEL
jgi:galactose mutarotase-like enzyme